MLQIAKQKIPVEVLDAVHKYTSSIDGHSATRNSQSRYQSATFLKRSCLQPYVVSDVLQILHIMIVRKKWLMPHSSGWQPLSLNTAIGCCPPLNLNERPSSFPLPMLDGYLDALLSGDHMTQCRPDVHSSEDSFDVA